MDEAEEKRWSGWEPEEGYEDKEDIHHEIPHGVDVDEALKGEHLPRRSLSPGLHAGLTLLLNVEKDEYYCSGTESAGFKVRPENQFSDPDQYSMQVTQARRNDFRSGCSPKKGQSGFFFLFFFA